MIAFILAFSFHHSTRQLPEFRVLKLFNIFGHYQIRKKLKFCNILFRVKRATSLLPLLFFNFFSIPFFRSLYTLSVFCVLYSCLLSIGLIEANEWNLSLSLSLSLSCPRHISRDGSISSCPSPICTECKCPCCTSPRMNENYQLRKFGHSAASCRRFQRQLPWRLDCRGQQVQATWMTAVISQSVGAPYTLVSSLNLLAEWSASWRLTALNNLVTVSIQPLAACTL